MMKFQPKMILKIFLLFPMIFYSQNNPEKLMDSDKEIKSISYEVTETIRTAFGSTKVVYIVSNKNMIYTYDLGKNNTREVKEIITYRKKRNYKDSNFKAKVPQEINDSKEAKESQEIEESQVANELQDTKESPEAKESQDAKEIKEEKIIEIQKNDPNKSITIIPLETYERLVEKGTRSSELFSQLADAYFYKNEYTKASKYYSEFFTIEKKIKPEFYLRYAVTLDKLGQKEKSKALLMTYEALLKNNKTNK
ncbi:hypothetical protein [Flavobacterium sp.]|uniref:tetratricopeptide repeat protein n=1 Tax=Flavobacterium sp. TaxID=239 RepID=UPI0022CAA619|nr:hypothetical protein [Flavobacterium sp.]MCZ8228128.1 hypothetical protein [Flavobacterium sp.]